MTDRAHELAAMPDPNRGLRGKYAIVGTGNTKLGKLPGVGPLSMLAQAMVAAVAEAGLRKSDVDALITRGNDNHYTHHQLIGEILGLDVGFSTSLANGGASQAYAVISACLAIEAGLAEVVLCGFGWDSHTRTRSARKKMSVELIPEDQLASEFRLEYGYFGEIATYALAARRHMHVYGTTKEQLGAIAVTTRQYASRNPNAQYREPFTLQDYLNAPRIVDPLCLLDCSPITDGAGAVVVTTAERARDLACAPVYILGFGTANNLRGWRWGDHMIETAAAASSKRAYRMAGIGPRDIDIAQLYDAFTYLTLVQLEDYGFCAKGEGGPFAASGALEPAGALPTNTAGGLLSEGHIEGMMHIIEATRQLRGGLPPERQVVDARTAIVSGHGGNTVCHATLILSRSA